MKRKLFLILALAAVCLFAFALCAGAVMLGDVDGNGKLESADARLALRASVKLENYQPGSPQYAAADADGNGKLESADARTILRTSVRLDKLPEDPAEAIVDPDFIDPVNEWAVYDGLIDQIRTETDTAKRAGLMHQAEDILMSNYCVIPLYFYSDAYVMRNYVDGVYSNPYGFKFFMYASKTKGDKTTLRINLAGETDSLDPALTTSVDGACLAANSFAGLYAYNAEGRTVPACAEGYTVSRDGLTYTVTLKKGLKWSDGSPLTAADFAYAWKRAADPETRADYEYMFAGFDGYESGNINVTAVNDVTLRFVLIAPCAYMEDLMAFPTFYPVKKAAVEADPDWIDPGAWCRDAGFVSNGAFVCTDWQHGTSMTYVKNPYYYDADKVTLDKLEFMLSEDEGEVFSAYFGGKLDFADNIFYDQAEILMSETKDSKPYTVDELGTYYIAFNAKSKLFDGKTPAQAACMRQAVSLLISRANICGNIVNQSDKNAADSFIPRGMSDGNGGLFHDGTDGYYDALAIYNEYDETLARARQLLSAAGYRFGSDGKLDKSTPLTIDYLTNNGSGHIAIAESIRDDLAVLGIKLNIRSEDWSAFIADRKEGNFTLAREGWIADFNDPINMLEMFTTSSGNNDCQFGR